MTIPPYSSPENQSKFNISPSSLGTFIDNPATFYKQHMLGERFLGNTASVFGTVLHAALEQYYSGEKLTHEDVREHLDQYKFNTDVHHAFILKHWERTFSVVVAANIPKPDKQEYQTIHRINNDYSFGGTVDRRVGSAIEDWKTCKSPKKDLGDYKWQLMTYALADRANNVFTDTLTIHYIVKPDEGYISPKTGKLIGIKQPSVTTVNYEITDQDWLDIEDLIKVVVATLEADKKHPELVNVLWRENKFSFRK